MKLKNLNDNNIVLAGVFTPGATTTVCSATGSKDKNVVKTAKAK